VPYPLADFNPIRISPNGLTDAYDVTDIPGACTVLQNLVPWPGAGKSWVCRPGISAYSGFPGSLSSPGFISVLKCFGSRVYGMVATSRNAGYDEPFIYDISTNTMVTVYNVLSTNVPLSPTPPWVAGSPPAVNAWTPPTMDMVGNLLYVTHPGFPGTLRNFFGYFNLTNPSLPVWFANNTPLPGGIATYTIANGGSGYVNGYYSSVPITGGSGVNASAFIQVSGGAVVLVIPDNRGANYLNTDTGLSASNTHLGGSGSGLSLSVSSITTGAIQLSAVPNWVRQFYNRAYFGVPATATANLPSVVFTNPLSIDVANANQALTFGNNNPLVAAAPLGLSNQLGGIINALIVFQDSSNIWQITGDAALSSLSINTLNVATGTNFPRAIAGTPKGLAFIANDGVRIIGFDANVSDPIGDLKLPFTVSFHGVLVPSCSAMSCNASILRVTVANASTRALNEYWFDLVKGVWSGPHTCGNLSIDIGDGQFIFGTPQSNGLLYSSPTAYDVLGNNSYADFGAINTFEMQFFVPEDPSAQQHEIEEWVIKTTIDTVYSPATSSLTVAWESTETSVSSSLTYTYPALSQTIGLAPQRIDTPAPVVYNQLVITYSGNCSGIILGDTLIRRKNLGYIQQTSYGS
jgi:hypothetical protein